MASGRRDHLTLEASAVIPGREIEFARKIQGTLNSWKREGEDRTGPKVVKWLIDLEKFRNGIYLAYYHFSPVILPMRKLRPGGRQ